MSAQASSDGLIRNIVNNVPVYEAENSEFVLPLSLSDAMFVDGTNMSVEEWEERENQ
jgi:hypothetical protein